jgi:uncharacterized protein (TIGR02246 family)
VRLPGFLRRCPECLYNERRKKDGFLFGFRLRKMTDNISSIQPGGANMGNRYSHAGLFCFVLFIFLCFVSFCGQAFAQNDNASIDKVRTDFNTIFNKGDAEAITNLFDKDGIIMPPGKFAVVGKNNIREIYAKMFFAIRSKIELKPGNIQSGRDLAVISGAFSRADLPAKGGFSTTVSGHYVFVLRKQQDGSWKISHDIWNETVLR